MNGQIIVMSLSPKIVFGPITFFSPMKQFDSSKTDASLYEKSGEGTSFLSIPLHTETGGNLNYTSFDEKNKPEVDKIYPSDELTLVGPCMHPPHPATPSPEFLYTPLNPRSDPHQRKTFQRTLHSPE